MSDSPEAIRKYIAPSPKPVIVSRTKVLISAPAPAKPAPALLSSPRRAYGSCDPQQLLDAAAVGEQVGRGAGVDDAAGVEHDRVAGDAPHHSEVLLHEQHRRQLGDALEHLRDLGDEQRREPLR